MNERTDVEVTLPNSEVVNNPGRGDKLQTDSINNEAKPVSKLTPEEQMALFEKELKENDWGHQPC